MNNKRVLIVCGGPSAERGISLNSARSVYDHLDKQRYGIEILYFNPRLDAYSITPAQIYSNTPLDFDFKLQRFGEPLSAGELGEIFGRTDVAIPAIHGEFGEDGKLQEMLEKAGVPYVGSRPEACRITSDKFECQKVLAKHGFKAIPQWVARADEPEPGLPPGRYAIKPRHGGSSLGVRFFDAPGGLAQVRDDVFAYEDEAVIEPLMEGKEFTVIVIENAVGQPVALVPTEIELIRDSFFDYRKKYLASADSRCHTPPKFETPTIERIRREAEKAFTALGMRDVGRLDGWLLTDGNIQWSDVNAISGMEQNSFLFQQAGFLGLSHAQLLDYLMDKSVRSTRDASNVREPIPVIFGGETAERQVSVLSGTNVWVKLKSSARYEPVPFLFSEGKLWRLPHFLCLHHTVEEIRDIIESWTEAGYLDGIKEEQNRTLARLGIGVGQVDEPLFEPQASSLEQVAQEYGFVFLGLHGGAGEDGTIQARLQELGVPFNGPGSECSRLCMDKFETGERIEEAKIPGVRVAKKHLLKLSDDPSAVWEDLMAHGFRAPIILKPRADGCSAGVVRIHCADELGRLVGFFRERAQSIPAKAIHPDHGRIDLPVEPIDELLIEEFISTDRVVLAGLEIVWEKTTGMVEVTVGVMGHRGALLALTPSQTVAAGQVLSLEEKFMGGTGVNLTPPLAEFVAPEAVAAARERIRQTAEALGIEGYSRIDTFMDIKSGELVVIEANTLPGLTASTVIFHQALAQVPSLTPLEFIEKIVDLGKQRRDVETQP